MLTLYRHVTNRLPICYRHITNCWLSVGRLVVCVCGKTCQLTVDQQSADSRPTVGRQVFWGALLYNYHCFNSILMFHGVLAMELYSETWSSCCLFLCGLYFSFVPFFLRLPWQYVCLKALIHCEMSRATCLTVFWQHRGWTSCTRNFRWSIPCNGQNCGETSCQSRCRK